MNREVIVVLDNVRSAHNVGSIFRTADGAGVKKIYLLGYTPTPKDRFGREQKEIAKTSLGATNSVAWEQVVDEGAPALLARLRNDGCQIVSIEQSPQSVMLGDFKPAAKVVYIFGNEIDGVSDKLLAQSDSVVELPMAGEKESLNVAVTAGIVLFYSSIIDSC